MIRLPRFERVRIVDPATRRARKCHLVKYTDLQYSAIKVGTLAGFRAMEGRQSDPMEGSVNGVSLNGPHARMTSEQFNRTLRGSNLTIHARDGIAIGPIGAVIDAKSRAYPNVFVFCCSMEFCEFPDAIRLEHFGATSVYVVGDPEAFGREVGRRLLAEAKTAAGEPLSSHRHDVLFQHGPVTYAPREPAVVTPELSDAELFVFQKAERFWLEQEYRLAWTVVDKRTDSVVSVQAQPAFIEGNWTTGACLVPV